MGPTWGPSGADRTQVGPMLAPWTLLSDADGSHVGPWTLLSASRPSTLIKLPSHKMWWFGSNIHILSCSCALWKEKHIRLLSYPLCLTRDKYRVLVWCPSSPTSVTDFKEIHRPTQHLKHKKHCVSHTLAVTSMHTHTHTHTYIYIYIYIHIYTYQDVTIRRQGSLQPLV